MFFLTLLVFNIAYSVNLSFVYESGWHSISTGDSICILALGSGERLLYPSNRARIANPVSVRVRVMVSASLSSAAVESPVLIASVLVTIDVEK